MSRENRRIVAVIAGSKKTAEALAAQMDGLLGRYIRFAPFSIRDPLESYDDFDMVLISTQTIFTRQSAPKLKTGTVILIIRRTLTRSSWERVMGIPPGKKMLLVNDEKDSTEETIALLCELGAAHVEWTGYYPGLLDVERVSCAITPGESELVPDFVGETIDIGDRAVDVSTLVDMLTQFDLLNAETRTILSSYSEKIIPRSHGLQVTLQGLFNTKNILQRTLHMIQDGVIAYNDQGKITLFNKVSESIFKCSAAEAEGHPVDELLRKHGVQLEELQDDNDCLVRIGGQKIMLNRQPIDGAGRIEGGVLSLKVGKKVEELELKLRLESRGYDAKHSFRDLITRNQAMEKVIRRAEKMAGSDLSVLILGESGTGKELFAHSIHRASTRAAYPFVAVNCSALPENLLESELFGYEEGAFTGARKGGKPGLFEQAHKGTIFLDEIGDISPGMQSRLLRVLQQKEVLKVGGTKLMPVDVRIIAATNKNLFRLAVDGKFREDLYYRLKVLQLKIPPLRDRREDILAMAEHFLLRRGVDAALLEEVQELLLQYHWPGNVREMENTMEYLAFMNDGSLSASDLLLYLEDAETADPAAVRGEVAGRSLPAAHVESFILDTIYRAKRESRNVGRRTIAEAAKRQGLAITESDVRKTLEKMQADGWVVMTSGRAGCHLTEKGVQRLADGRN
jgi:Transcriptional regulator containing PAS, AAA-type ATPase, and DNA-binding domains